jgi:hypothetical protein
MKDPDVDRANSVEIEVSVAQRSAGQESIEFSQSAPFISGRFPPIASVPPRRQSSRMHPNSASSRGTDPHSETQHRSDALKIGLHQRVAPSIAELESILDLQHLQLFSQGFIVESALPSSVPTGFDSKQTIPVSRLTKSENPAQLSHQDQHALASSGTACFNYPAMQSFEFLLPSTRYWLMMMNIFYFLYLCRFACRASFSSYTDFRQSSVHELHISTFGIQFELGNNVECWNEFGISGRCE